MNAAARIELAREPDMVFGSLRLMPALREIAGTTWRKTLEPRVMQVLVSLARANGSVVSRHELIAACWGGRAVGEDAIYRCVSQLRRLLAANDSGCAVETVPRVGYRLSSAASPPGASRAPQSSPLPDHCIINDLIGHIYDCALDPTGWDDALAHLVSELAPADWDVAGLLWEQMTPPAGRFVGSTGFSVMARDIYCEAFAGRTPWSKPLAALALGQVVDTDEIIRRDQLTESAFYKTFLSTWGMELAVVATLDRDGPRNLGFAMPGPPGRDLTGLKRGLRMLAPHMQRAIRISRSLGEANLRAEAAIAAIERAPVAVVTLTADLCVVNANAKALAFTESGQIAILEGRFAFRDVQAQAQLAALAAGPAPASAIFKLAGDIVVLAARVHTHVARALAGDMEGASIVLTMGMGERAPLIEIDRLGTWFGLTPTEARLAVALARGASLLEYSQRRHVTMNAIKSQLKNIYRKTNSVSLPEVVQRVRALL